MADVNHTNDHLHQASPSKSAPSNGNNAVATVNRASGAFILVLLFGILWVYGFAGEIRYAGTSGYPTTGLSGTSTSKTQTQSILGNLYIIDTIFVVIGFGLLFAYFKKTTFTALFIPLFITSLTAILSPIFQKFWFNVFITNFSGMANVSTGTDRFYQYSLGGLSVYLDYYNLRIALANVISQLVVFLAVFGRVSYGQIIMHSFGFNFVWNLNHFLCVLLAGTSPDSRLFDDYQISNVYLFAACYGLLVALLLNKPPTAQTADFSSTSNSAVLAHLGTFFLFLSFCATTTLFSIKSTLSTTETARSYLWQEAFLSIFIAMSASIIFNYAFSALFNAHSKFGIRGSLVGTISGAIMYGSVAGTCINIGAAIAVGLFAGFLSALFFEKIYPALNRNNITDTFGITFILIVSFLGTFFIAPTVIKTYYNYSVTLPTLDPNNSASSVNFISKIGAAGWSLVYVGISMGIGLLGGLIIGLIVKSM